MTLAEAPPGTWGYQVCAAASLAFLRPRFARCAVWSWGAHPDCGLCVAGLVQPPGGRYGQPVVKTHQGGFSDPNVSGGALGLLGRTFRAHMANVSRELSAAWVL